MFSLYKKKTNKQIYCCTQEWTYSVTNRYSASVIKIFYAIIKMTTAKENIKHKTPEIFRFFFFLFLHQTSITVVFCYHTFYNKHLYVCNVLFEMENKRWVTILFDIK